MPPAATRTYRTSAFAALGGVTPRALRLYDRLGLLKPRRSAAGYRLFRANVGLIGDVRFDMEPRFLQMARVATYAKEVAVNESIEVQFRKNDKRLRVKRQLPGGIEFDEPDPLERTVGIRFSPQDEITRMRMDSIRRVQGWEPGQYKLSVSVEDGSIILRGVDPHALAEGRYGIRVQVEEAKTTPSRVARVTHDGKAVVEIPIQMDDRTVRVDLSETDRGIRTVLERSNVDGVSSVAWLADPKRRPVRRACLLNLMASLRTTPTRTAPLLELVHDVFYVANDRIYAKVDRRLLARLQELADDLGKPVFAEGRPRAAIHGRLLTGIPEPPEVKSRFTDLRSYRAEGRPSMQAVVAVPPADLPHTYAEFDLDLGNPLQDLVGFLVHMGELLDGKPTNHLDIRRRLSRTRVSEFLYYTIESEG